MYFWNVTLLQEDVLAEKKMLLLLCVCVLCAIVFLFCLWNPYFTCYRRNLIQNKSNLFFNFFCFYSFFFKKFLFRMNHFLFTGVNLRKKVRWKRKEGNHKNLKKISGTKRWNFRCFFFFLFFFWKTSPILSLTFHFKLPISFCLYRC